MMALSPRFAHRPSPNHGARAPGSPVDMIVLHHTGMANAEGALAWLCDPRSEVSSHYFVFEDGRIVALVDEGRRAWHAGLSCWAGETDINSRSIGIEIAHEGEANGLPYPDAQVDAVIALCHDILGRHPIPPERVLGHADVAPLRKEDPGRSFPWRRLHEAGVGHWVPPAPIVTGKALQEGDRGPKVAALRAALAAYGYGLAPGEAYDPDTGAVVRAFQRHFRPERVDGIADASTIATLERLGSALFPRAG